MFIFGYVICLMRLARLRTTKLAFYGGLAAGLLCFAPQLGFFRGIFKQVAIVLWVILALWIALFVTLASVSFKRLGATGTVFLTPFLWMGLEYFRSEPSPISTRRSPNIPARNFSC